MSAKYQAYPEYKDSESKWLDILPKHWGCSPLKNLVGMRITDGPHETPEFIDEGIPFLSAEAIKNNSLDFTKKRGYITKSLHEFYSKKCLPQIDDIFMIKSGNTTGALAIVETKEEFNIWSPLALIRANQSRALPRFIFYSMQADFFQTSVQLSWSQGTQPNIGMGIIENLHISTAPLNEQKKIISFLDHQTTKIDTLIEKQQLLIKLLKEKRQAVISHAVTKGLNPDAPMRDSGIEWLGEVPEHWIAKNSSYLFSTSPRNGISPAVSTSTNAIPTFSISAVRNGKVDIKNNVKWTSLSDEESKRFRIKSNTILLVRGNGNLSMVGQAGLTDKVIPNKCIYPDILIKIELSNSKMTNEFFVYAWNSFYVREQLERKAKTTNGTYKVSGADIKNITLAEPPIEEQKLIAKWIAEAISKLEKLMDSAEIMLRHLKERRTALISAAVTGKIDVRNWRSPEQIQLNGEETP